LHRRNGVRLGIERDRDGGMPKALGDDLGWMPACSARVAWVWRRSCRRICGSLARLPWARKARLR